MREGAAANLCKCRKRSLREVGLQANQGGGVQLE